MPPIHAPCIDGTVDVGFELEIVGGVMPDYCAHKRWGPELEQLVLVVNVIEHLQNI